jgi:hypothetical protein
VFDQALQFGLAFGVGYLPSLTLVNLSGGDNMAKSKFEDAAVKIGSAVGQVEGKARKAAKKAAKAADVAKRELNALSKQVDALKKQLQKSTKQLKKALQ